MIDTLIANMDNLRPPKFMLGKKAHDYFILTRHRPANIDDIDKLEVLINAIGEATRGIEVIFPVHPRTLKSINSIKKILNNFKFIDPLPYLDFNYLVQRSKAVITDSGGIIEEATVMGLPCLTLRDSTERPETVNEGTNELVGTNPDNIKPILDRLFANNWKKGGIPELWDGKTSDKIVSILEDLV